LNLSAEIKVKLDNLRNLGHPDPRFQQTNFVISGNFKNLIKQLNDYYIEIDYENQENQDNLEISRQSMISLNLYPPSKFKNIDLILKSEDPDQKE
jgi:hypothetical protein